MRKSKVLFLLILGSKKGVIVVKEPKPRSTFNMFNRMFHRSMSDGPQIAPDVIRQWRPGECLAVHALFWKYRAPQRCFAFQQKARRDPKPFVKAISRPNSTKIDSNYRFGAFWDLF